MAIWDDIRKGLRKISSAAEDGVKKVSRSAESAAKKVEDTGKKGVRAVEDAGKKGVRAVDSAADDAKKGIESAADDAKEQWQETVEAAEYSIEQAKEAAKEEIGDKLEDFIESALETGLSTVFTEAADKLRDARDEINEFAAAHPDLVDGLDEINFTIDLNIVQLHYANFFSRIEATIEVLDTLANEPPEFRRGPFLSAVEALGPDSVDCGFTIPIAIVGISFGGFTLGLFLALGDIALAKMGVPE